MQKIMLTVIVFLLGITAVRAKAPYEELHRQARQVFNTLSIGQIQLSQEQLLFGMPSVTWLFEEPRGFEQLLQHIERNKSGFEHINIMPHQILLSRLQPHQELLLWIKRHKEGAYSGALSILRKHAEGDKSLDHYSKVQAIAHLEGQGRVLMDVETEGKEGARQWIYHFDRDSKVLESWLRERLIKDAWRESNETTEFFKSWTKEGEEVAYSIMPINQGSAIYVLKRNRINNR